MHLKISSEKYGPFCSYLIVQLDFHLNIQMDITKDDVVRFLTKTYQLHLHISA